MRRKDSAIQQQVANLQMKIVQEDRAVESRTTDLLTDWEKTKPVTVSLPGRALVLLSLQCSPPCLLQISKACRSSAPTTTRLS